MQDHQHAAFIDISFQDLFHTVVGTPHYQFDPDGGDGLKANTEPTGWTWDGATLTVFNDRYGTYPIFYSLEAKRIRVSVSLVKLLSLGVPPDLDDAAVAVLIRCGFLPGNDTPFKAIRIIPPAARFKWTKGQLTVSGSLAIRQRQDISLDKAIPRYIELFRAAMERRAPPEHAAELLVPLSGGRDSRHILLELVRLGYWPHTLTIDHGYSTDPQVASTLSKRVGVPHTILSTSAYDLKLESLKNYATHFSVLEHDWILPLDTYLLNHKSIAYEGIAGDVLSAAHFYTDKGHQLMSERRWEEFAAYLVTRKADTERVFASVMPHWAQERFSRQKAIERLLPEIEPHASASNPVGSFHLWNRTRRAAALGPFAMLLQAQRVYTPFLDYELYDFLASLPLEYVKDHTFHTRTISRAYPEYADIPYSSKGVFTIDYDRLRSYLRSMIKELAIRPQVSMIKRASVIARLAKGIFLNASAPAARWYGPILNYLLGLEEVSKYSAAT